MMLAAALHSSQRSANSGQRHQGCNQDRLAQIPLLVSHALLSSPHRTTQLTALFPPDGSGGILSVCRPLQHPRSACPSRTCIIHAACSFPFFCCAAAQTSHLTWRLSLLPVTRSQRRASSRAPAARTTFASHARAGFRRPLVISLLRRVLVVGLRSSPLRLDFRAVHNKDVGPTAHSGLCLLELSAAAHAHQDAASLQLTHFPSQLYGAR